MSKLQFDVVEGSFTIHRLLPGSEVPAEVFRSDFFSMSQTNEELSIVCPSIVPVSSEQSDSDWACLKVIGPLDFSLTGILARISGVLAEGGVSIFALSTYDTDYILVKADRLDQAKALLCQDGHSFED